PNYPGKEVEGGRYCTRYNNKGRPKFFRAVTTSSATEHLRRAHSIYREDPTQEDSKEEILQASSSSPTPTPSKRPRLNYSGVPKVKVTSIQDFCVATIITNDLPFYYFKDTYLRQVLQHHSSKTSPNIYAFIGITGHFLSANSIYQSRLLRFPQQLGQHTGINQADTLLTITRLYSIKEKVGVSVSDNATNNDTYLNTLLPQLDPYITNTDIKAHRLRCYSHILNLTYRAFLFSRDSSTLKAECDFYRAIGKLQNIVYFIRASPQRTEAFKKASQEINSNQDYQMFTSTQSETRLLLNNDTRWNSTYLIVKRAITKKVELQAFILANQDMINLAAEEASQTSQSRQGRPRRQPTTNRTFNKNILSQHVRADWQQSPRIISRFNTLDEQYQSHLRSSIKLPWQKLFRYYDRLSDSPLNAASIILHPSLDRGTPAGLGGKGPNRRRQQPIQAKELELYLRQPPERTSDPTRWWINHREIYPQLNQLALNILAIPAMSSDCKRAFSSAKLTLTSQRLRIKPNTVKILQLLKNWLKRGTIQ
ncbi:transposase-like protein, partial [Colletotrichum incanum]